MPENTSPTELPTLDLELTAKQIKRLSWIAYVTGALAVVLQGLGAMGLFDKSVMQALNGGAMICTGLAWYFARQVPVAVQALPPSEEPKGA